MNHKPSRNNFFSLAVIIGGLVIGALLLAVFIAGLILLRPGSLQPGSVNPVITVIAAPTAKPITSQPTQLLQNTTPTPATSQLPTATGPIKLGSYVQISNTGGEGLRIRSAPGTNTQQLFLGMESEVFQVTNGPKQADGYTWWYLVAPYDKKRAGWAASDYLTPIKLP